MCIQTSRHVYDRSSLENARASVGVFGGPLLPYSFASDLPQRRSFLSLPRAHKSVLSHLLRASTFPTPLEPLSPLAVQTYTCSYLSHSTSVRWSPAVSPSHFAPVSLHRTDRDRATTMTVRRKRRNKRSSGTRLRWLSAPFSPAIVHFPRPERDRCA